MPLSLKLINIIFLATNMKFITCVYPNIVLLLQSVSTMLSLMQLAISALWYAV